MAVLLRLSQHTLLYEAVATSSSPACSCGHAACATVHARRMHRAIQPDTASSVDLSIRRAGSRQPLCASCRALGHDEHCITMGHVHRTQATSGVLEERRRGCKRSSHVAGESRRPGSRTGRPCGGHLQLAITHIVRELGENPSQNWRRTWAVSRADINSGSSDMKLTCSDQPVRMGSGEGRITAGPRPAATGFN